MFSPFFILSLSPAFAESATDTSAVLIKLGGEVISADQQNLQTSTFTGKPISIDLLHADIHSLIRLFAAHTGRNFIISEGVQGTVSVKIENAPWDQALAAILSSQGLVAINIGEITVIQAP